MSKTRHIIQMLLSIGVMIIGIYMLWKFDWPTPPAISGLGFLLAGLAIWTPYCLVLNVLIKDKKGFIKE